MEATSQSRRRRFYGLGLEALEDRTLLSTFMVDRLTDTGEGSGLAGDLRYCITQATSGQDTIGFGVTGTINLTAALPDLTTSVSIDGPGPDLLTVRRDTGGAYRIFKVGGGATVEISGLTIADGGSFPLAEYYGGGIFNAGTLTVSNSTFSGNSAVVGGGIYNSPSGVLTVSDDNVSGNRAFLEGGGIANDGTLTVSNSTLSGNQTYQGDFGGAIFNGGALTVSNSTLSGNHAKTGGGIYNGRSGVVTMSNCTLSSNSAFSGGGGGIYNDATLTVSNTLFSNNTAGLPGGFNLSSGGGILNGFGFNGAALTISNCTFSRNTAPFLGSAISIFAGSVEVGDSTVSGNSGRDGAIYCFGATTTISNCTISGNTGDGAGGIENNGTLTVLTVSNSSISGNIGNGPQAAGGIVNNGTLTISNCTISGNTGSGPEAAGGIRNNRTLTVINSTISGNTGGPEAAGGITNTAFDDPYGSRDATTQLLNSTVANNTVSSSDNTGSELFCGHTGSGMAKGTIQLRNTIISGDGSKPNFFAYNGGTFVSQGHNLSSDDGGGFLTGPGDLVNADPLLGSLQDNGGPTWTMALLPGSPAVDAGDNTDAPLYDQRGPGFARIVGGVIDIGAFEVQPGPATQFQITAPAEVVSGTPFDVTVTALDPYGHRAIGYLGTVTFTSTDTDSRVVLPPDYTFTAADQGLHNFIGGFTLITAGNQTLAATDTADITLLGGATITVDPGPSPPPGGGAAEPIRPPSKFENRPTPMPLPNLEIAFVDRIFASAKVEELGFVQRVSYPKVSADDTL